MGSSKQKTVTLETGLLKEDLGEMYRLRKNMDANSVSLFETLWDLKEHALLEGKKTIEIPTVWLEEFQSFMRSSRLGSAH